MPTSSERPARHRGQDADRGELRVAALRRAHRDGRVALGELDRVVALGDGVRDVLRGDVLVEVDERLAAAPAVARVGGRRGDRGLRRQRVEALALVRQRALAVRAAQAERDRGVESRDGAGAARRRRRPRGRRRRPRRGRCRRASSASEPARRRVVAGPRAGLQQQRGRRARCRRTRRAGRRGPPRSVARRLAGRRRRAARTAPVTPLRPSARTTVMPASSRMPAACTAAPSSRSAASGRRSAIAAICTPAARSASAASSPRSPVVATTAVVPGRTAQSAASRRAPPLIMIAGEVVVLEDERLLDRARRRDVALRADLVQRVALPDRDEAVVEAERGRLRRAPRRRPRGPRRPAHATRSWPPSASSAPPGSTSSSASTTSAPWRGRGERGRQPGDPAADDEHVAVAAPVLRAPLAVGLAVGESPEAGDAAQRPLVQRPGAARPLEGLVVEAGRGERAARDVGDPHDVEVQRRPGVLVLDDHALAHDLARRADARRAVDLHERARALPGPVHLAARAVVLERAREDRGARRRRARRRSCRRRTPRRACRRR